MKTFYNDERVNSSVRHYNIFVLNDRMSKYVKKRQAEIDIDKSTHRASRNKKANPHTVSGYFNNQPFVDNTLEK